MIENNSLDFGQSTIGKNNFNDDLDYGIICIVDALATKGIWSQRGPINYINVLDKLENDLSEKFTKYIPEEYPLSIQSFSDTFFITMQFKDQSSNTDNSVFVKIFSFIIADFFLNALAEGVFFRGAISHGLFCSKGKRIIGPAVDDVAMYFEKPEFIGVVYTPSTGFAYHSTKMFTEDNYDYCINYETPLKFNSNIVIENLVVIDWPKLAHERSLNVPDNKLTAFDFILRRFADYPIPNDTYIKYKNTIDFFNYSMKTNNLILSQEIYY